MLTLRRAEDDADLEAYRVVFARVVPDDRCPTVAELRRTLELRPERLLLVAYADGTLVGSGLADRSDEVERGAVVPRVLPEHHRRGHGTAILTALLAHAQALGFDTVGANVDDDGSLAFARHHGAVEYDRQVEQVRRLGVEPWPDPIPGIDVVSVAERPELWTAAYHQVAVAAVADMAVDGSIQVSAEEWEELWMDCPESTFVALDGDLVVGVAGLMSPDRPGRAENTFTGVRRDHRGRGIATLLKRTALAWAADHGLTEVTTWTQERNADMRALNEKLGYDYRHVSRSMRLRLTG